MNEMNNEVNINIIKKNIRVSLGDKKIYLSKIVQENIELYWSKCVRYNPHLTRGKVFCIGKMENGPEDFCIELNESDYAHYLYSINHKMHNDEKCAVCFAAGLVETEDRCYIIGRMNKKTSTPFRYQLPGGGIGINDIKNGIVNLDDNLRREIIEELNIDIYNVGDVDVFFPAYLKSGGSNGDIAIVYKIRSSLKSREILLRHKQNKKREFESLVCLKKKEESIECFFEKHSLYVDYLPGILKHDLKCCSLDYFK